jgi:hypothetical protein
MEISGERGMNTAATTRLLEKTENRKEVASGCVSK